MLKHNLLKESNEVFIDAHFNASVVQDIFSYTGSTSVSTAGDYTNDNAEICLLNRPFKF